MSHLINRKTFILTMICGLVLAKRNDKFRSGPDSFVFPDENRGRTLNHPVTTELKLNGVSELSKSLELAKKMNSISTVEEFLELVKGVPSAGKEYSLANRFGDTGERSNAERPLPAKCMPEMQPVSLKQEIDPSTIYFPSCTRIMKCGGCCDHSLLSCQPTATQVRNFQVVVVSIGKSSSTYENRIVPLEEHTECQCDCKIKEEHCSEKQTYIPEECRCSCDNVDEAEKCSKNNDTKVWNPDLCTCFCREEQECSTGFYFDQNTCRCERKE